MRAFCAIPAFLVLAVALVSHVSASGGCFRITAAYTEGDKMYVIDGNEFIKLNADFQEESKGTWMQTMGLKGSVDAAAALRDNTIALFQGDKVFTKSQTTDPVYGSTDVSKLGIFFKNGIDAAARLGDEMYYFKGCRYATSPDRDAPITNLSLECNLDAVFNWAGFMYVFKGNQYWVIDSHSGTHGPRSLDTLVQLKSTTLC